MRVALPEPLLQTVPGATVFFCPSLTVVQAHFQMCCACKVAALRSQRLKV